MNHKIKAFLVDDEADGREVLQQMLARYQDTITIVGAAQSADEACRLIPELSPDLVFLDVQMPGRNGFEVLSQLASIKFEVIFVTSFEQYALTAIKFNALDYLLKPLDDEEFHHAIEKARHMIARGNSRQAQIDSLLGSFTRPEKIAVHQRDHVVLVDLKDIQYIQGEDNYSKIVTCSGQHFTLTRPLKDFESYFGHSSAFVRINKSIMLNIGFIASYSKKEPCIITLKSGATFEVSRRKKQEVLSDIAIKLG